MTNQGTDTVWTTPSFDQPWVTFSTIKHPSFPYTVEDPFLWIDSRANWHIINHEYSNIEFTQCARSAVSAHFYSTDGISWNYSAQPYAHTVVYDDGTQHDYVTLERPNLHFDAQGVLTHINLAADLITGDEGCENRTDHAHNGHTKSPKN